MLNDSAKPEGLQINENFSTTVYGWESVNNGMWTPVFTPKTAFVYSPMGYVPSTTQARHFIMQIIDMLFMAYVYARPFS